MKNFHLFAALAGLLSIAISHGGDYELTINGKKHELDLNKAVALELADGTKLEMKLNKKDYLTFVGNGFQFEHHNSLLPSVSDLEDGITQLLMATPRGTGVLIQTYDGMDPNSLVDVMINELTKEEVAVGYELAREKASRKVGDEVFRGAIATTTSKAEDEQWAYEVLVFGDEKGGILIATFVESDNKEADAKVVERFWNTLALVGE